MKFFVRVNNEVEKWAVLGKFESWGVRWSTGKKATQILDLETPDNIWYNYFDEDRHGIREKVLTTGTKTEDDEGIPEANILDFLKAEKIADVLPVEIKKDCTHYKLLDKSYLAQTEKAKKLFRSIMSCEKHGLNHGCRNCPDYKKKKKVVRYYQRACVNKDGEGYIFFKNDKRQILFAKSDLDVSTAYDTKVCPDTHRIYIDCEVDND